MAMGRNKCFYRRCNFCAQIAKHLSDVAYQPRREVARSLVAVAELARHGVRAVNFNDEAMRPTDVRQFVAGIQDRGLRLHWVGRMIAAADPDRELLWQMRDAGCVEVLFGLESFDPETAARLGKISGRHDSPEAAVRLVETFGEEGIFTILSMISGSPVTSAASAALDERYLESVTQRSRKVAVILNRFALFRASRMFAEPQRFGIGAIEPSNPDHDLQTEYNWTTSSGATPASLLNGNDAQRWKLGMTAEDYRAARRSHTAAELDGLHFWDYCSLGLQHRIRCGKTILAECFPRDTPGETCRAETENSLCSP
jgi:hypothetical protein